MHLRLTFVDHRQLSGSICAFLVGAVFGAVHLISVEASCYLVLKRIAMLAVLWKYMDI